MTTTFPFGGRTALRVFGLGLVLAGVALGVFAYHSLANAVEMGRLLARATEAMASPIDSGDWTRHWRANSVGEAILAAGGIAAGIGFLARNTSIRELLVRNYRLVYQVSAEGTYVLRIVHGARRLPADARSPR